MGAEAAYIPLIAAAIGAGGGIGTALLTPSPQERRSYKGTTFDPVTVNTDAYSAITSALKDATQRARQPVELPNAVVGDMPTFTGGGLPSPVGVVTKPQPGVQVHEIPPLKSPGNPGGTISEPPPGTYNPGPDIQTTTDQSQGPKRLPTTVTSALSSPSDMLSALPQRLSVKPARGGYAAGGSNGAPAVPNLSPQARGAVQLLLQSIQGGGGAGAAAGFR